MQFPVLHWYEQQDFNYSFNYSCSSKHYGSPDKYLFNSLELWLVPHWNKARTEKRSFCAPSGMSTAKAHVTSAMSERAARPVFSRKREAAAKGMSGVDFYNPKGVTRVSSQACLTSSFGFWGTTVTCCHLSRVPLHVVELKMPSTAATD